MLTSFVFIHVTGFGFHTQRIYHTYLVKQRTFNSSRTSSVPQSISKLVYVIGWGAVVFGINCASNAGKKL